MTKPFAQVLIYPWVQLVTMQIPSYHIYHSKPWIASVSFENLVLWYLGDEWISGDRTVIFDTNEHLLLLNNEDRERFSSYLNISLIPEEFRAKKNKYYEEYSLKQLAPFKTNEKSIHEFSILNRNATFAEKIKLLFTDDISPALADDALLKEYPRTYQIVCEWDAIKDEQFMFAERMRKNRVKLEFKYYEKCYHGMVTNVDKTNGYKYSMQILDELIDYLKSELNSAD
jgi:acetyl esterase/lipase